MDFLAWVTPIGIVLADLYPLVYENKWLRLELSQLSIGANNRKKQFAVQRDYSHVLSSLSKRKDYAKMDKTVIEILFR